MVVRPREQVVAGGVLSGDRVRGRDPALLAPNQSFFLRENLKLRLLNARLALVPILNIALVSKELVSGVFHWQYLALIFGSTCVYAAAALAFCVHLFNREEVLFRT